LAFEPLGRLNREATQGFEVELGPSAAVVAGVAGWHRPADLLHVGGYIGHGGGTGGAFAVFQGLGEEGPEHDGRGEGCAGGEQGVALDEGLLDVLGRKHVRERQTRLIQEGSCDELRPAESQP